jgi:uncharacterized protein YndB with AHSA1/START domain
MRSRPTWKERIMATTMVEQKTVDAQKTSENLKLEITRVIRASRQRVFDAWTRPEFVRQWFAPGNMVVHNAATDPRVSGEYRIAVQGSTAACEGRAEDGDVSRKVVVSGRYVKVEPYDLLSFTWKGDGDSNEETLVTVALKDVEGGTELTLTHERFASEELRDKHEHGWTSILSKLGNLVEGN